jgi:hypothetical protein
MTVTILTGEIPLWDEGWNITLSNPRKRNRRVVKVWRILRLFKDVIYIIEEVLRNWMRSQYNNIRKELKRVILCRHEGILSILHTPDGENHKFLSLRRRRFVWLSNQLGIYFRIKAYSAVTPKSSVSKHIPIMVYNTTKTKRKGMWIYCINSSPLSNI